MALYDLLLYNVVSVKTDVLSIGIYEFYNNKECLNLHEVIEKLVSNKKINLLAAA
jgi:hypothetical protein